MVVVRSPLEKVDEAQTTLLERMPGTTVKEAHLYQVEATSLRKSLAQIAKTQRQRYSAGQTADEFTIFN